MAHGFGESQDGFFESAIQYALNGIIVHTIDLECHGHAAGTRISGLRIDSMHFYLTAMISRFQEGLPTFLYGNSMGCMVINTFLLKNPDLKLAGVVFSAPFFAYSDKMNFNWFRQQLIKIMCPLIKVSFVWI
jgi:alpha-beta hydrolase superfamily lysophospholipase